MKSEEQRTREEHEASARRIIKELRKAAALAFGEDEDAAEKALEDWKTSGFLDFWFVTHERPGLVEGGLERTQAVFQVGTGGPEKRIIGELDADHVRWSVEVWTWFFSGRVKVPIFENEENEGALRLLNQEVEAMEEYAAAANG